MPWLITTVLPFLAENAIPLASTGLSAAEGITALTSGGPTSQSPVNQTPAAPTPLSQQQIQQAVSVARQAASNQQSQTGSSVSPDYLAQLPTVNDPNNPGIGRDAVNQFLGLG